MRFPEHPAHRNRPQDPRTPVLHIPRRELHQLTSGRKTQHRLRVSSRLSPTSSPYPEGEPITVQAGGGPAVCRVIVTGQRTQYVGRVSLEDARAEGYRTRADFARAWISRTSDWCHRDPEPDDTQVLEHFDRHYAPQLVWVIEFRLDRAPGPEIMLTPAARPAGSIRGYTTRPDRALPGEPPVVEPDPFVLERPVSPRPTETGKELRRREEHLRREADNLLKRARREILATGRAGEDVTLELEALKRLIDSVRSRRREAA